MDSLKLAIYCMAAISYTESDLNIRVKFAVIITEKLDALNSACPLVQSPPSLLEAGLSSKPDQVSHNFIQPCLKKVPVMESPQPH